MFTAASLPCKDSFWTTQGKWSVHSLYKLFVYLHITGVGVFYQVCPPPYCNRLCLTCRGNRV